MNITVYCGANNGSKESYKEAGVELGMWIAKNHDSLIYGGGNLGLMGLIADTVLEHGGKVIGIIPEFLVERELAHQGLTQIKIVENMQVRKLEMIELGDCYIALPGGLGTLEEIAEVISWARLGQNSNPCIFYNSTGFYDKLKDFLIHMVEEDFLSREDFDKILFANNIEEMDAFIKTYKSTDRSFSH